MIWVAAAGVVMNGGIALLLMRGHRDINLRSALLHEIGDTLSMAAVIAGGIAIAYTGQHWIDPALSVGIGVMILWSSIGIIRESLNILLEGTPSGMELDRIHMPSAIFLASARYTTSTCGASAATHIRSPAMSASLTCPLPPAPAFSSRFAPCWGSASRFTTPPSSLNSTSAKSAMVALFPSAPDPTSTVTDIPTEVGWEDSAARQIGRFAN